MTLSSALVAFAFAYFRFPFRNLLFGLVLASMMLPGAVTMVPTFLIWDNLGKVIPAIGINTLTPLWATNLFGSAFYIFLLRQFYLGLPREVFEAARVDGANYLRMWWSDRRALTLPALVVVFIFELKASWTDFFRPLIYIRDVDLFTLPRGLKLLIDQFSIHGGEGEIQLVMAAAVLVTCRSSSSSSSASGTSSRASRPPAARADSRGALGTFRHRGSPSARRR